MDKNTAVELLGCVDECREQLNNSVAIARAGLAQPEFVSYRRTVGKLFDIMREEILNPAYAQFPELAPPGWFAPNDNDKQ